MIHYPNLLPQEKETLYFLNSLNEPYSFPRGLTQSQKAAWQKAQQIVRNSGNRDALIDPVIKLFFNNLQLETLKHKHYLNRNYEDNGWNLQALPHEHFISHSNPNTTGSTVNVYIKNNYKPQLLASYENVYLEIREPQKGISHIRIKLPGYQDEEHDTVIASITDLAAPHFSMDTNLSLTGHAIHHEQYKNLPTFTKGPNEKNQYTPTSEEHNAANHVKLAGEMTFYFTEN